MQTQYEITQPRGEAMLVVQGLDDATLEKLRTTAARHGRSVEAEVRQILVVHVNQLLAASGSRIRDAQAPAPRTQLEHVGSRKCERVTPMTSGLRMLLDIRAD